MKINIIPDDSDQGEYIIFNGEVERVIPIRHYFEMHINRQVIVGASLARSNGIIKIEEDEKKARAILTKMAVREWPARLKEMESVAIPDYLINLLSATDKAAQLRLLKNATITADQLIAFILKAGELGYTYSKYHEKQLPSGIDATKFPHFFVQEEDGSITTVGRVSASEGQMRQVLEQRKVIAATILDKGEDWHCFFATYRGLAGKENYKGGQPHLHYISSKWGSVTRQQVLDGMRAGTYISNNAPHIDLLESAAEAIATPKIEIANVLPPLPLIGTGLLEATWLGTSGSVYAHHYPANKSAASCGHYKTVAQVRAAWADRATHGKPHCPNCERRVAKS